MTIPKLLRHAIAARHVEQHEDYLVQDYLRMLRREKTRLRRETKVLRRVGFSPSGRYVFGRLVAGLLLAGMLVGWALWWEYSGMAAVIREALTGI